MKTTGISHYRKVREITIQNYNNNIFINYLSLTFKLIIMKITKKNNMKASILALLFGGLFLVASCSTSSEDEAVMVNKSALTTINTTTQTLLDASLEGSADGQYILGSKAALQTILDVAKALAVDANATQIQVDNLIVQLNQAITLFGTKKVTPIDVANLVGQWTFDEGTGTTVKDYSTTNATGTFGSSVLGTGTAMPTWTTDRYGNANKAIAFNDGAKITVPYNAKLNPAKMSISLWINAAEKNDNNRFMGMHSWNGYKFQLQGENKPFFTGATTADGIYDRDSAEGVLEINVWYHLTVTFGDGHNVFYINGTKVKDWDNTAGTLALVTGHDLTFGVDSSKYAATDANYGADNIIPAAWAGYFRGSLDDIRMYKSVLTEAQVKAIYDTEKKAN
jgi:hypothetical protein